MNNDGRDNKSLENLVDVILTKIAEELTGSRDKYLEYVMSEKGDGEWSRNEGSGFSGQGFNDQGFNGQGGGFNANPPNTKGKKLGTVTKVVIGIIIAVLVLTLPILIALGLYSAKPDSNRIEESNIDEGTAIEEQEALDSEETTDTTESDDSISEGNNPNTAAMAALMAEEPDVKMEYIDCIIKDMEYGENNNVREITVVLKNTGNRIVCSPSVAFLGDNEGNWIGSWSVVLPGQYVCLNNWLDNYDLEILELNSVVEVIYDGAWNYVDIPLEGVPETISVQECMTKEYDEKAYPRSEISYLNGSVVNSDTGSDIGLEIVDMRIKNDHVCVEIRNNTEYTIQEARVVLCELDENGNIIDSGFLLNYEKEIPPGETATEYHPLLKGNNKRYAVPVFWDYTSDADSDEPKYGMTYIEVIPKAVGH